MIHNIKITPEHFQQKVDGVKPFEVRINDRNYNVGDYLVEQEFDPIENKYTGNFVTEEILCILDDETYCRSGYVIMGTKVCAIPMRT